MRCNYHACLRYLLLSPKPSHEWVTYLRGKLYVFLLLSQQLSSDHRLFNQKKIRWPIEHANKNISQKTKAIYCIYIYTHIYKYKLMICLKGRMLKSNHLTSLELTSEHGLFFAKLNNDLNWCIMYSYMKCARCSYLVVLSSVDFTRWF